MGFTLGIVIVVQIVTGLFISFHYSSDINEAYYSVFFLIREIYYGWSLRFLHSSGASFVFLFVFLHIGRSLFYGSFFYNPNTWFSGILILLLLMGIAFLGYVLPFGQMSFWGATVITNLLSPFPCLIEWLTIISPENLNFYNIFITLHGLIMIFFLVMPVLFGGYGNFLIPIFQGSPEVVYPRANNFSILILFLSYFVVLLSLISEFGGGTG